MIEWQHLPTPDDQRRAIAALRPVAYRAMAWSTLLSLSVLGALRAILPSTAIPWGPPLAAGVILPGALLLAGLVQLQRRPGNIRLTSEGYRRERQWRFRWKGAVGWGWVGSPPIELVLVGKGGVPVRLPAPPKDRHAEVGTFLRIQGPELTPAQLLQFTTPVTFSALEALWLSIATLATGVIVGSLAPLILHGAGNTAVLLLLFALLTLPPSILAWRHLHNRYPGYTTPLIAVAGIIWFLTVDLAMLFGVAFMLRHYYGAFAA